MQQICQNLEIGYEKYRTFFSMMEGATGLESKKKGQRKRKSAGVGDIFEVSDKDLSPEPEEIDNGEPEAKVLKTQNSDVSESRQNNVGHNLKNEELGNQIANISQKLEETHTNDILNNDIKKFDNLSADENVTKADETLTNPRGLYLNDNILEDGEVNDTVILDDTVSSPVPLDPSITIKFDNKSVADIYKPKFIKFIQSFIELEVQNLDAITISVFRNTCIDPTEWVVLDGGDTPYTEVSIEPEEELAKKLPGTPKIDSPKKKKKKKKKLEQRELFVVDTNPGVDIQKPMKYSTKFLINDEKQDETKAITKPVQLSTCFNCGKEHSLKDCTQPKNYNKINANRQKFVNKNKTSRYHLEEQQKYSHLQPGKISQALQKALGLKKNQMPSYIYQMRILGYPPGWLEEAKVVESELAMFDIDGNNVKNTNNKKIKGLDPDRVINYPGFNIPLEKEYKDEYKFHRVPAYSEDFSKENMIDYFQKKFLQEEDDHETQDMDLDNTNDLLAVDVIEVYTDLKGVQNKQLDSIIDSDSNTVPSPSLNDLEKQKKSLLEQLKKPEEPVPWDYPSEDVNLSSTPEEKDLKENTTNNEDPKNAKDEDHQTKSDIEVITPKVCEPLETTIEINISESNESRNTSSPLPTNSSVNCVKNSTFGTPIIKSTTPYNHLPNPDNFSKGVSPVIDFENLPNSTGKYEQMTGVLKKVRDTLKKKLT